MGHMAVATDQFEAADQFDPVCGIAAFSWSLAESDDSVSAEHLPQFDAAAATPTM